MRLEDNVKEERIIDIASTKKMTLLHHVVYTPIIVAGTYLIATALYNSAHEVSVLMDKLF